MLALGVVLLLIGATLAAVVVPRLRGGPRARLIPFVLLDAGALVGAGAALVRDYDLLRTTIIGALLFPVLGLVMRRRGATG
ncbi:MAG: hypothetical protein KY469_00615 [Actinobacteria bacterium]|nr:hypothetical protein [Actinomycetota bacterium]